MCVYTAKQTNKQYEYFHSGNCIIFKSEIRSNRNTDTKGIHPNNASSRVVAKHEELKVTVNRLKLVMYFTSDKRTKKKMKEKELNWVTIALIQKIVNAKVKVSLNNENSDCFIPDIFFIESINCQCIDYLIEMHRKEKVFVRLPWESSGNDYLLISRLKWFGWRLQCSGCA